VTAKPVPTFAQHGLECFRRRLSHLKRSNSLFWRNSGRETGSHFRWNCSSAVNDLLRALDARAAGREGLIGVLLKTAIENEG
jgi:hypothetical protein